MRTNYIRPATIWAALLVLVLAGCQQYAIPPVAVTPTTAAPAQAVTPTTMAATTPTAGTQSTPTVAATATTQATTTTAATATRPAGTATVTAPVATATATLPATTPTRAAAAATFPVTITDDAGRSITIQSAPQKIVSLAPSNTEILYALGLGARVAAVSQFDNYPEEVKDKPKIGTNQLKPNIEQVVAVGSDLVLAIGGDPDSVQQIADKNIPVIVLAPPDINGVLKNITMVGQATGQVSQADALVSNMQKRIDDISQKVSSVTNKPKVFLEIDATDPTKPFTVGPGSFIDSMINMAGGQNIASDAQTPFPQLSLEEVVAKNPDIIILNDANFGTTPESVKQRPGWSNLNAVLSNKIYPFNDDLSSRPGPRVVDGLEAMAKLINPDLFR